MEIECQGCYYTLCSFICLTEDLSEILQFLWKHGCLRRSYSCEKCGRKCAIGDKDLFFRCNRNTLGSQIGLQQAQDLSSQTSIQQIINTQQPSQLNTNSNGQAAAHHSIEPISPISHNPYAISQLNSSELSHQNSVIPLQSNNSNNFMLVNHDKRLQNSEFIHCNETIKNDTLSLTLMPNSLLSHGDINEDKILTIIDSQQNDVLHLRKPNNSLFPSGNPNTESQPEFLNERNHCKKINIKTNDSVNDEPPLKIHKFNKGEGVVKAPKKRCNFKVSMKKGTFFEKSKLPIDTVCKFVVFWCCMKHPTQEFLRNELSLATRTVVDWSTTCREICIHWAKSVSEKIGGDGVMVQIDEVKIQEKDSKQNNNGNRYSFWGMEKDKEKGKIFIVTVPSCDTWSLLNVIDNWILPGSVIISNCWKAYDCLKLQEFIQQTVVQSKTFVHPQNNAGHQNFDGKIDEAGASAGGELQMPRFGTRRSHHLGDLAEFMFKRRYSNHLERMHAFFKQVSLAYPLH